MSLLTILEGPQHGVLRFPAERTRRAGGTVQGGWNILDLVPRKNVLRQKAESDPRPTLDSAPGVEGVQPEEEGEMIRLLLVDDEASVRRGLRMQLSLEQDVAVVGEAGDGEAALALVKELRPDVVVMDVNMRGMDGITATETLCQELPGTRVVILTLHDDTATRNRAEAAGARAFIGKHESCERLVSAIRSAAPGANVA